MICARRWLALCAQGILLASSLTGRWRQIGSFFDKTDARLKKMDVVFERLDGNRYAVAVCRGDGASMRMDPAPGFDVYFPHDMQHLIVEEQLGITGGIFGRLAAGGTASTFRPVGDERVGDDRSRSRHRRRLRQQNDRLGLGGSPDFGRSERATFIVWHDWLAHCPESGLVAIARDLASTAADILDRMAPVERHALCGALPYIRVRVDSVAREWASLSPGEAMTIPWMPRTRRT